MLLAGVMAVAGLTLAQSATAPAARAAEAVAYDSIPGTLPSHVASMSFESEWVKEMGALITLAPGENRIVTSIDVGFVSWSCETGVYNRGDCETTPGSSYTHPATVTLYRAGADGAIGEVIARVTQDMTVPYRPSPDTAQCTGGKWWDGGACVDGLLFTSAFDFSGVAPVVDDQVIVSVSYNTYRNGLAPTGTPGPYDYLNLAVGGRAAVGGVDENVVYLHSSWPNAYMDRTGEVDVFRPDSGWEAYGSLMLRVTADAPVGPPDPSESNPPTTEPAPPASAEDAIAGSGGEIPNSAATSDAAPDGTRTVAIDLGPSFANQWYYVVMYSAPTVVGWVWVGANGQLVFQVPATLPGGAHTVALLDANGAVIAHLSGVHVPAILAATGADDSRPAAALGIASVALLAGALVLLTSRRRLRARA